METKEKNLPYDKFKNKSWPIEVTVNEKEEPVSIKRTEQQLVLLMDVREEIRALRSDLKEFTEVLKSAIICVK